MQPKDLIEFFQKMLWLIGFNVTVCRILRLKISKKTAESARYQNPYRLFIIEKL